MSCPLHLTREATIENLPVFLGFIEQACQRVAADAAACFAMKLTVEEVLMNLINHACAKTDPATVDIRFSSTRESLIVTIRDHAAPFHPDEAPPLDLDSGWEDRREGGLGWHLVKQMIDEIRYVSDDNGNCLTLVKHISTGS